MTGPSSDGRGRRAFLRAAGGVSAVALSGCARRVEQWRRTTVPVLQADGTVLARRRVPRRWASHVETVRRVRRELGERVFDLDGVVGLKVTPSPLEHGGRRGLQIGVEVANPEESLDVPEEVEGIPVQAEEALDRGTSACYNDGRYDPIPGGVVVGPGGEQSFGTACCRVTDGGDPRLLTAAHLWQSCGDPAEVWSSAYQADRQVGRVDRVDEELDAALVALEDGVDVTGTIERVDGSQTPVGGVVSEWGLAVLLTEGATVQKVGTASGVTAGELTAFGVEEGWNRCVNFGGHGVEAAHRAVVGDSGGPVYYPQGDHFYLVNVQQMWVDRGEDACEDNTAGHRGRGTAAAHIRDELDVVFAR